MVFETLIIHLSGQLSRDVIGPLSVRPTVILSAVRSSQGHPTQDCFL